MALCYERGSRLRPSQRAILMAALLDHDAQETREWLDALDSVLQQEGPERAHYLLEKLIEKARRSGAYLPYSANTAYINTIPPGSEEKSPGDHEIEHHIRSYVRWNAAAMVKNPKCNSACRKFRAIRSS